MSDSGRRQVPGTPNYELVVSGSGIAAINTATGSVDYSVTSGDHVPVVQAAVNNLCAAGGPTGGQGGRLDFKGLLSFLTQLELFPDIALCGQMACGGANGCFISSAFAGSAILLGNDARGVAHAHITLQDFLLNGNTSTAGQNGVEVNGGSGTNLKDVFMRGVQINSMGQHGLFLNSSSQAVKVFGEQCEFEACAGNGIDGASDLACTLSLTNSYIANNTGKGYNGGASYDISFTGTRFTSNGSNALALATGTNRFKLADCTLDGNGGGGATPQVSIPGTPNGGAQVAIGGNLFSGALTNHINLASGNIVKATIVDNHFVSNTGDAVTWLSRAGNLLIIENNRGYNDVRAKIALPFSSAPRIGACAGFSGSTAAPVASTAYPVEGSDLYVVSTGGTGVSITITDSASNTVQSGLATFSGILPVGYAINFGAFTVAPTVYVGVK